MAFSEDIKREFIEEIPNKTCCRRAFAYGILFDSFVDGDRVYIDTSDIDYADFYRRVFERQFSKQVTVAPVKKAGREHYRVEFDFPSMANKIATLDKDGAQMKDYIEFKCPLCRMNLLRGIFITRATLTFAPGNNHLEFKIKQSTRARVLSDFLAACKVEPKMIERKTCTGLYYKKADRIEDILNIETANKITLYHAHNYYNMNFTNIRIYTSRKNNHTYLTFIGK